VLLLAVVVSNGGGRSTAATPSVTCGGRGSRHDYFTLLRQLFGWPESQLFGWPETRLTPPLILMLTKNTVISL
jgi:hypothetical protein